MTADRRCTARLTVTLLSLILLAIPAAGQEPIPLLVDTDMGLDDMRAIALMLDAGQIKVHGISTVFGSQEPRRGGRAMIRLLGGVGHRRIPIAPGAEEPLEIKFEPPPWRPFCETATDNLYGNKGHILLHEPAHEMLSRLARREGEEVRLVCLGPLTNLALALEADPGLPDVVHTLLVVCADTEKQHFNISADPEAARQVLEAPWKRVVLLGTAGEASPIDFSDVLQGIERERIGGRAARVLGFLCGSAEHLLVGDELASLYLTRPSLFTLSDPFCATVAPEGEEPGRIVSGQDGTVPCRVEQAVPGKPGPSLVRAILDNLSGLVDREQSSLSGNAADHHGHQGSGTLLMQFPPLETSRYRKDVAGMVDRIVAAHGPEEWRWSVLAGEIHGHLGIYSIVGVKMGLRALELLATPRLTVELAPHCGSEPPLSCLQDGLIVSTGATPGRGLLISTTGALLLPPLYVDQESDDPVLTGGPAAAASFYHGERMITIRLLPEVQQLIGERIGALARQHGGTTSDSYFTDLRSEALRLQLELDRNKIFEVFE